MFIDINDLRINYIDEGEDNGRGVILLLHGWGSNITLFKNIVDMLSPHMRVVAPDMAGFGESDEYFAQILDRVRAYLPVDARFIGGAMCQGKMGMGVKRRYEGMLEKDPENAQARMLIDNWNKAQSHPNEDDVSRIAAAAKEALEGIAE